MTTDQESAKDEDIVVHLDEKELADKREKLDVIMERLDAQLALKNATVTIIVVDAPSDD